MFNSKVRIKFTLKLKKYMLHFKNYSGNIYSILQSVVILEKLYIFPLKVISENYKSEYFMKLSSKLCVTKTELQYYGREVLSVTNFMLDDF